jgi:small-conductance mechanosensitive channel
MSLFVKQNNGLQISTVNPFLNKLDYTHYTTIIGNMIQTLIKAVVAGLVLYLIYVLLAMIIAGVFLTVAAVILILVYIGYLLKVFGINF